MELAEVMELHKIPGHYPMKHLAGYRMDVENVTYNNLGTMLAYCWLIAGLLLARGLGGRRHDGHGDGTP